MIEYEKPQEEDESILGMKIEESKKEFLKDGDDSKINPYLNEKIAQSWKRSYEAGVDPSKNCKRLQLSEDALSSLIHHNQLLIKVVSDLFEAICARDLIFTAGNYCFCLFDRNSTLLFTEGQPLPVFLEKNNLAGTVWSEESVGTTAHSLALEYKEPITLIGSQHYCNVFSNSLVAAAPIFNEHGQTIAVLAVSQHLLTKSLGSQEENYFRLEAHALGLVSALAASTESRLHSYRNDNNLRAALTAVIGDINQSIVTVDMEGKIVYANNDAQQLLEISEGQNITAVLKDFPNIVDMARTKKTDDIIIQIGKGRKVKDMTVSVQPFTDEYDGQVKNIVLKFYPMNKEIHKSMKNITPAVTFEQIIGKSSSLKRTVEKARNYAKHSENILLMGESGTGKELFARAIHENSRPNGPFIAINCAAMPSELIESELFGYEGGSFTGAEKEGRPGKIELAQGGTLFLDEIGDMPLQLQAVLLRVLQDKQVIRVGGSQCKLVDFQLIAATNRDIFAMQQNGQFREDLYYRLSVLSIKIPPLKERHGDAGILFRFFVEKYCNKVGKKTYGIDKKVIEVVNNYSWPGNIRELESAVIQSIASTKEDYISIDHLPTQVFQKEPPKVNMDNSRMDCNRQVKMNKK